MHVPLCGYVSVCVVCVHVPLYVCVYVLFVSMFSYLGTCMCMHVHACSPMWACLMCCVCVCIVYMYVPLCMCVCVVFYMHIALCVCVLFCIFMLPYVGVCRGERLMLGFSSIVLHFIL